MCNHRIVVVILGFAIPLALKITSKVCIPEIESHWVCEDFSQKSLDIICRACNGKIEYSCCDWLMVCLLIQHVLKIWYPELKLGKFVISQMMSFVWKKRFEINCFWKSLH